MMILDTRKSKTVGHVLKCVLAIGFAVPACGGSNPEPTAPLAPAEPAETPVAEAKNVEPARVPAAPAAKAKTAPEPSPEEKARERAKTFTVADFDPPFERTTKEGDGKWVAVPEAGEMHGAPLMLRSMVHPDKYKWDRRVAIVAMDLERLGVRLVAGSQEPKNKRIPGTKRGGVVPEAERENLVAVFNGGFQTDHGLWGSMIDQTPYVKPREIGCTFALFKDESVKIGAWSAMQIHVDGMRSYRQSPPCLVEESALHPDLIKGFTSKAWATSAEGRKDIRRSAVGVDATGRVLFFGLGEWVTAKQLGSAMMLAGAVSASQLDVNWIWTKFLFYGKPTPEDQLQVTATLVPKIQHSKRSYLVRPRSRDFFYVVRRDPLVKD